MSLRALCGLLAITACIPNNGAPAPDASIPVPCTKGDSALMVTTLAGCQQEGQTDGTRDEARFQNPTNVAIAPDGSVYVSDFDNDRLRRIDALGVTSTVIERIGFSAPFGLAIAADGALYVQTDDNDRREHTLETGTIWRYDPTTGEATVIARDLGRPRGLAVLPDGRIAMSDHIHHVVSILDPSTGGKTALAGTLDVPGYANATGGAALFAQPYDVVVLPDGDLAVADLENHRIRRVTLDGVVTDFAGSGAVGNIDGPANVATFDAPKGLAIANATMYVTDVNRHFVRRIRDGTVATVSGDGTAGWIDHNQPRDARFYGMEGIDVDATRLLIADGNGGNGEPFHRVRTVLLEALP